VTLYLERVPGESRGEVVFRRDYRGFTLWVKHEYEAGPWEWLIFQGKDAIAFGDAVTQKDAEGQLAAAAAEIPEIAALVTERTELEGEEEGILRVVGRLVVGRLRRGLDAVDQALK
jgi:hypothetical protein